MEESGENWPSDSYLEASDDVDDFCFDDEEFGGDEEGDSFSETVNPMMSETDTDTDRKRKQRELTERFLALSATIPGYKKMEKTWILEKASKYVKELEQRVRDLEQEVESSSSSSGSVNSVPEIKVRVLQKDVLIIIHCQKQKGIMLKILSYLQTIHLSVVNSSVLRFGKSTLDITIIAQMDVGYNMTVGELVKALRGAI